MRERSRATLKLFLAATFVALFVRFLLIENFRVSSSSMNPTLVVGDLLLVSKFNYGIRLPFTSFEMLRIRRPQRGEVVVFTLPESGTETFVKRVVALEGDTVAIKGGVLKINQESAGYLHRPDTPGIVTESMPGQEERQIVHTRDPHSDFGPVVVPPGHFFVLGDNRLESRDSRRWGPVPLSYLRGKVWFVWLPARRK